MASLFKYLKGFKKEIILGPCFKLVEAIFELIVPLVMADIIDTGIKNSDGAYILSKGALMVVLSAVGLLSTLVCQYFAARASQGFGTVLRSEMFRRINSLSHSQVDFLGRSSLNTRITNDVNQIQVGLAMFIRLAVRAPFLVVGATVMAMSINFRLSLIFVFTAAAIVLGLYAVMSKTPRMYAAVQKLLERVLLLTRENLAGARIIRAFARQRGKAAEFDQAESELLKTQLRVGRLSALLNPLTFLIVNLGIIAVLWFGGGAVDAGVLEQGAVVALINYLSQILLALVVVANLVIIFTRAATSAGRVAEVLDMPEDIVDGGGFAAKKPAKVAVEFDKVYFAYPGGGDELTDVNLKIYSGEMVGIIGGTGAGKTTLVNLIPRFFDATAGAVRVDGANVKAYALGELRSKIGLVPQQSRLFSGTVRDNVRWGDEGADDAAVQAALRAAQADFVFERKEGLDYFIEQGGRNLSGGQRQRLAIARALVRQPRILILDDATSALDYLTEAALRSSISKMGAATVIMVSQRVSTLKSADRIVVLDDGVLAGVGTHEELFKTSEVYREICLSQMSGEGSA